MSRDDEVRRHYELLWGAPSRTAHFTMHGHEIVVYKWNPEQNPEEVNLYATSGVSALPMPNRDPGHRVELWAALLPARDEIAASLALTGFYPLIYNVALGQGDTVTNQSPVWPGTPMHAFVLVGNEPPTVPPLVRPDDTHVEFLQAVPLFPSELAYKKERGMVQLWDHFERHRVPFWDPDRPPAPVPND